ncbi:MAG: DNA polymerase Y family protein [Rhodoferax sp.]|nr:DNA polymerase Y family protein [Rhodoferax sp.]
MHWIALRPEAPAGAVAELSDPARALGWWALRYTPRVARVGSVVLLEVSGSVRLWGGLPALLAQVLKPNSPLALDKYAQAATSLIALAELEVAPSSPLQAQAAWPVDALPLSTLAAAQPHLPTLARLGCATWGQLRALPRAGVARRFGALLLDALDQAYGQRPEVYPWLTLPVVFDASLELPSAVQSASALLFAARRLLAQLRVWLQLRQQGVLGLELIWYMDERRHTDHQGALPLRSGEPTQDSGQLQRLLAEHLARVTLPAPVHTLRLRTLALAALAGSSASLLSDATRAGDGLTQTLERLSARLGAGRVLRLQPRLDHRPEQMQCWSESTTSLIASSALSTGARGQKSLENKTLHKHTTRPLWAQPQSPTWLLAEPLALDLRHDQPQYHGALTLLAGPQRLEAGWWGGGALVLRDYFVARSAHAGLLWIYRQRLGQTSATGDAGAGTATNAGAARWYLHGLFA